MITILDNKSVSQSVSLYIVLKNIITKDMDSLWYSCRINPVLPSKLIFMPIKFYLKGALKKERLENLKKVNPKAAKEYLKKPLPLLLSVSRSGERVQIPLGISIPPSCWDGKRIKDIIGATELNEWNTKITDSESKVRAYLKIHSNINKVELICIIKDRNSNAVDKNEPEYNIIQVCQDEITKMKKRNGFLLSKETLKKFTTTINHMECFIIEKNKSSSLKHVNQSFFDEFNEFLYQKNLNDNTVPKYLKAFNFLIQHLDEKGYPTKIKSFKYTTPEYEPPVFIVDLEEIMHLIDFKFNNTHLERVRDLFIFMCFTGQRISDIKRIKWSKFTTLNKEKVWINTTQKTHETITIPIPDFAMDVLSKYEDSSNPIPVMSEQYFNRSLKIMAKLAELNRFILNKNIVRGEITEEMVPLYSKISSHIARKSFITNALILGMSEREVKTISGHKDDRSFRRYVQIANHAQNRVKTVFSKENIEIYLKGLLMNHQI